MKIIAGKFRGRNLATPENDAVRPTTGRMRERVFSMLQHRRYPPLAGGRVMDVFAGTGALGLEALSRGAGHVTFVENSPGSIMLLNRNIHTLDVKGETSILRLRATEVPKAVTPMTHIFLDPPYGRDLAHPAIMHFLKSGHIGEETVIICEMQASDDLGLPSQLEVLDDRRQGIQRVLFLGMT